MFSLKQKLTKSGAGIDHITPESILLNPTRKQLNQLVLQTLNELKGLINAKTGDLYIWCSDFSAICYYDHSHIDHEFNIGYGEDSPEPVYAFYLARTRGNSVEIDQNFLLMLPKLRQLGIRPSATGGEIDSLPCA